RLDVALLRLFVRVAGEHLQPRIVARGVAGREPEHYLAVRGRRLRRTRRIVRSEHGMAHRAVEHAGREGQQHARRAGGPVGHDGELHEYIALDALARSIRWIGNHWPVVQLAWLRVFTLRDARQ